MLIRNNISAMNAFRRLNANNSAVAKSLQKLSSGFRINSAADDAAGLAISLKMRGQVMGLGQASRNAQDGISLIQTAEGALSETHSILQRMRELAMQSTSDTYSSTDRSAIQTEVDRLTQEITNIAQDSTFNTQKLLDGSLSTASGNALPLQVDESSGNTVLLHIGAMDAQGLGLTSGSSGSSGGREGTIQKSDGAYVVSTVSGTPGFAIDGETVTLSYDPGTEGNPGSVVSEASIVNSQLTVSDLRNKLGAASDAMISLSVNGGTAVTITASELRGYNNDAGVQNGTDLFWCLWINSFLDIVKYQEPLMTWKIRSPTTGSSQSIEINVTGSSTSERDAIKVLLGMSDDSMIVHGTDTTPPTPGTPPTITISDNNGHAEVVNVNDSDTTFAGTGYFAGLSVHLKNGSQLSDLTGGADSSITFAASSNSGGSGSQGIDVSTQTDAENAIHVIDNAITTVSSERANLGAIQNRLEHTVNNLGTADENLTAAESRICDMDIAQEMMEYTKDGILAKAAMAMLAQANQQPQSILRLLGAV